MKSLDFTAIQLEDKTPEEAFRAINNVRGWWSEEIEGKTNKLDEEFTYQYKKRQVRKLKIIEFIPYKKVVWQVLKNSFGLIHDETEWKETKLIFEISENDKGTKIHFTHWGVIAENECFDICSNAWKRYIQESLRSLALSGKGHPNPRIK